MAHLIDRMNRWLDRLAKAEQADLEARTAPVAAMPHCDAAVLHAPGECVYCDRYPEWQRHREMARINFTGHHDPDRVLCPSETRRPLENINRWPGNRATRE